MVMMSSFFTGLRYESEGLGSTVPGRRSPHGWQRIEASCEYAGMKRVRQPQPKKIRRNPLAKALREGIYRKPRIVERADRYKRRPKHPKPPKAEEET
jgi:hypothetical protein